MKKNIFKALSLLLAVSLLTSCLKDDRLVLDPEKGNNVIEFANPATITTIGSVYPMYTFAYAIVPSVTLPITISYSGPEATAPEDIVVNFGAGTEAEVDAYNTDQDAEFTLMPSELYKLSTTSVTIKKGESKASFSVTFTPDRFDFELAYVLPLKITSASSGIVSGNFNTILLSVNAKNKYDGVYKVTGTFNDTQNSTFTVLSPQTIHLVTQNATQVAMYDPTYFGTYINLFRTATGVSGYGSFSPLFTFDTATDKITDVVNYYGQPAPANGRSGRIDITGINKFDPASKTIEVSYVLVQNGDRTFFKSTMVFQGDR